MSIEYSWVLWMSRYTPHTPWTFTIDSDIVQPPPIWGFFCPSFFSYSSSYFFLLLLYHISSLYLSHFIPSLYPLFARCLPCSPVLRLPLVHVTAHKRHLSNGSPEVILLLASVVLSPPSSNSILPLSSLAFSYSFFFFSHSLIPSIFQFTVLFFSFSCFSGSLGVVYLGWMRSSCGPGKYGSSTYQVYGASQCTFPNRIQWQILNWRFALLSAVDERWNRGMCLNAQSSSRLSVRYLLARGVPRRCMRSRNPLPSYTTLLSWYPRLSYLHLSLHSQLQLVSIHVWVLPSNPPRKPSWQVVCAYRGC